LSQIKRAAEGVWGKLLRIQLRHRFLNQIERITGQLLIIQGRRGFLSQVGMAERGQWRENGEGRSEMIGGIKGA
jgi:hypothetical protein